MAKQKDDKKKAIKCDVCKEFDLIPSGCGCLNPKCCNFKGRWPKPSKRP